MTTTTIYLYPTFPPPDETQGSYHSSKEYFKTKVRMAEGGGDYGEAIGRDMTMSSLKFSTSPEAGWAAGRLQNADYLER